LRQTPFVEGEFDYRFRDAAIWAAEWVTSVLRFSMDLHPLRRWISENVKPNWEEQGFPEMDAVFTPRALQRALETGYRGGRVCLGNDEAEADRKDSSSSMYVEVLRKVQTYVGLKSTDLGDWYFKYQSSTYPEPLTPNQCALLAWRAFWESGRNIPSLVGNDVSQEPPVVQKVLEANFPSLVIGSGFPEAMALKINALAEREVLQATFIHAIQTAEEEQTLEIGTVVQQIQKTRLPVFFVRPIVGGALVDWIHSREPAGLGRAIFA
jgi:hypothetical protein